MCMLGVLPVSSAPDILRSTVLPVHVEDDVEHTPCSPGPYFLCSQHGATSSGVHFFLHGVKRCQGMSSGV